MKKMEPFGLEDRLTRSAGESKEKAIKKQINLKSTRRDVVPLVPGGSRLVSFLFVNLLRSYRQESI